MTRLSVLFSLAVLVLSAQSEAKTTPSSLVPEEIRIEKPSPAQTLSPNIRHAASSLKMNPELVQKASEGLMLIFKRDYRKARAHFTTLQSEHPELAIGNVGRMLIFQCLMLENFDYRFERQYQTHAALALRDIEKAQAIPGNEAWELFLKGGVLGIQGIHEMRKSNYVASMKKGLEALGALKSLQSHAPEFVDPELGNGLYYYWRTVVGKSSKLIPEGPDRRAEGIALIEKVEKKGAFVAAGASLALAYIYMEEGKSRKALGYTQRLSKRYPNNVINGLLQTRILMRLRRFKRALVIADHVLATDTDNHRVHYYKSTILMRQNRLDEAQKSIEIFLSLPIEKAAKAYGLHRKADIYFRQKNYDQARVFYKKAVDTNGYGPSKRRLTRLDQMKEKLDK